MDHRTSNLIHSSASFTARQLDETSQEPVPSSKFHGNAPAMSAHAFDRSTSVTGHSLPKRKTPTSKQTAQVPKTVFLLDQGNLNTDDQDEDEGQNDEYIIKEEMILVKEEFDLFCCCCFFKFKGRLYFANTDITYNIKLPWYTIPT